MMKKNTFLLLMSIFVSIVFVSCSQPSKQSQWMNIPLDSSKSLSQPSTNDSIIAMDTSVLNQTQPAH